MATIELTRIRPHPLSIRLFTEESTASSPRDIFQSPPAHEEQDESSAIHPPWKRHLYQLLEQPTSSAAAFVMHTFSTSLIVVSAFVTVLETVPAVQSISPRIWFGVETSVVALFTVEYIARLLAWSNTWSTLFRWVFCTSITLNRASLAYITSGVAFYGVIDLLSVLPYYLELILLQDTVMAIPSCLFKICSDFFFGSPSTLDFLSCACSVCCACSGRSDITTPFYCMFIFVSDENISKYSHLRTIEVMFLSVRRSQHALLAIGFFVIMILTVFSTLL